MALTTAEELARCRASPRLAPLVGGELSVETARVLALLEEPVDRDALVFCCRSGQGSVTLLLCTAAHPLYIRFAKRFGSSISEVAMRPNPRSGSFLYDLHTAVADPPRDPGPQRKNRSWRAGNLYDCKSPRSIFSGQLRPPGVGIARAGLGRGLRVDLPYAAGAGGVLTRTAHSGAR